MCELDQTYMIVGFDRRGFGTGFKGRINAQQPAHKSSIADKIHSPIFHPNKLNKNRESGPKVIEPMPVPAVTIPNKELICHIGKQGKLNSVFYLLL